MEVIYGLDKWQQRFPRIITAIGNFDGVHLGHQKIIRTTIEQARARGGTAMVMTFEPHPEELINPANSPPLLTTGAEKARILRKMGVDVLLLVEFNEAFRTIAPREFITGILKDSLGLEGIVVGYNYRFGNKGEGTTALLRRIGEEKSMSVTIVPPVVINGTIVSSTKIRQLLGEGKVRKATELLGRYLAVEGIVVHGDKRGRNLGFPTANLQVPRKLALARGVYLVKCWFDNRTFYGVANVGMAPTFSREEVRLEIFLFDFSGEIYGKKLSVDFLDYLRPERQFRTLEELKEQINADILQAKGILEGGAAEQSSGHQLV
ncbi:MAG: bifunctional riboflavin kinase/FAD synthetase [bacterium]|jgi:riboflavin kinase/FMN adenylyltransferase